MESNDQRVEQLLKGIYKLCSKKEDCNACPFYDSECVFDEPKPKTWYGSEAVESKAEESRPEPQPETKVAAEAEPEPKPAEKDEKDEAPAIPPKQEKEAAGTWLVSTTMGSVFTKYVYICSKCGYRKESVLSIAPTAYCPECEKKKNQNE